MLIIRVTTSGVFPVKLREMYVLFRVVEKQPDLSRLVDTMGNVEIELYGKFQL